VIIVRRKIHHGVTEDTEKDLKLET